MMTDLNDSRASSHRVIRHSGIATRQNNVGLPADGSGAVGCGWYSEGEASFNGGCAGGWWWC